MISVFVLLLALIWHWETYISPPYLSVLRETIPQQGTLASFPGLTFYVLKKTDYNSTLWAGFLSVFGKDTQRYKNDHTPMRKHLSILKPSGRSL